MIDFLEKSGRLEQARAETLSLKSVLPADAAVRKRTGHLLLGLGMAGDAAAVFRELLESDPVDAESQAGLGEAELALNHLLEAQAAFREATRLQPGNPQYQARAQLLEEVVSMNPALPGLDVAERYKRSRRLLGTALAAFDQCREEKGRENSAANETAAAASAALKSVRRPRSLGEATRTDINLAAGLWSERGKLCGAPGPQDEALARAIADASR